MTFPLFPSPGGCPEQDLIAKVTHARTSASVMAAMLLTVLASCMVFVPTHNAHVVRRTPLTSSMLLGQEVVTTTLLLGAQEVADNLDMDDARRRVVDAAQEQAAQAASASDSFESQMTLLSQEINTLRLKTKLAEKQYELLELQQRAQIRVDEAVGGTESSEPSVEELRSILKASQDRASSILQPTPAAEKMAVAASDVTRVADTVAAAAEEMSAAAPDVAEAINAPAPAIVAAQSTEMTAAEATAAALQALQDAGAEVSTTAIDPETVPRAVQATREAIQAAQAAPIDWTPPDVALVVAAVGAVGALQYLALQAVPRVGSEVEGDMLPGLVSLAADAHAKSTAGAASGKRNALEIFYRGLVNLEASKFEGWFFGSNSDLYSNMEPPPSPEAEARTAGVATGTTTHEEAPAIEAATPIATPSVSNGAAGSDVTPTPGASSSPSVVASDASPTDEGKPSKKSFTKKGKKGKKAKKGKAVSGKVVPTGKTLSKSTPSASPARRGDGLLFPSD